MKKVIVTTTINPPTKAVRLFDAMAGWDLVVVGDLKTPKDYRLDKGFYLDPAGQEKYDKALSDAIGWNCIQRRNFGLLVAREMKADLVAVVDDDNIPLDGWGEDVFVGNEVETNYFDVELPAFDPVGATNYPNLWHRGYPLELISKRSYRGAVRKRVRVDIQADFWNGDPDIDAICRLEHAPECEFDPGAFPIAASKLSPFNSQNTFLSGSVLKDYFLFPHIGRMDDIWASYYAQSKGSRVVYGKASVYQERNVHDLIRDMKQEYLGYENNLSIVQKLPNDPSSLLAYLPGRAVWAFELYRRHFVHA
jgi:hypothetical protein